MSKGQVNISLPGDLRDVLEALAFLEGCSAAEVLRPLVEQFLSSEAQNEEVSAALAALRQRRDRKAAEVDDLSSKRQASRRHSDEARKRS